MTFAIFTIVVKLIYRSFIDLYFYILMTFAIFTIVVKLIYR